MKIVIIEDEKNAREYLIKLLIDVAPDAEIVEQLDSVKSAVNFFATNPTVDLVFLDIQIADGLSFEIFNYVDISAPIIFTTAYDQYALEAFKLHSVDYLLKPIMPEDLKQAILQYKNYWQQENKESSDGISELIKTLKQPPVKQRCLVKKGGHYEYVNVKDIAFINSSDSLTFLHTFEGNRYIYTKTLEQLYHELDKTLFFQINRSQVLNSSAIKEIHPFLNQRLKIMLNTPVKNELEFIVSRKRMANFKEWIDN